jgi:hypothetical protein
LLWEGRGPFALRANGLGQIVEIVVGGDTQAVEKVGAQRHETGVGTVAGPRAANLKDRANR